MSKMKDLAIKLFGKSIPCRKSEALLTSDDGDHCSDQRSSLVMAASQESKERSREVNDSKEEHDGYSTDPICKESVEPPTASDPSAAENEASSQKSQENEDRDHSSLCQEQAHKKPDKIIPCPRCNSMETKFCYYNNYNVNQPRHFCKDCQRYWTAGGSMRNVPVGSGRRKNKSTTTANFRHIMISDALQAVRNDSAHGIGLPIGKRNGTVLTFGAERPLSESMPTVLNIAHEITGPLQRIAIISGGNEGAKDHSNCSSMTTSNSIEKGGRVESVSNNFQHHLPNLPPSAGPPWPTVAFDPAGFPVLLYPALPYVPCAAPVPWNMQMISVVPPSPNHSPVSASHTSYTLRKHSRDGSMLNTKNADKDEVSERKKGKPCILNPKTLRIADPNEAAMSSIWATLGIKNDKDLISGKNLFMGLPSNGAEKNAALALQANPAAFLRSQCFQESTQ